MLLKVEDHTLWYANIVNFMVAGYYLQVKPKEDLNKRPGVTFGMNRTSTASVQTAN